MSTVIKYANAWTKLIVRPGSRQVFIHLPDPIGWKNKFVVGGEVSEILMMANLLKGNIPLFSKTNKIALKFIFMYRNKINDKSPN